MSLAKTGAGDPAEPFLFVYGTLRRDARGPVQRALTRGWAFCGYGTVAADLYDLGPYPGAVPSAAPAARVRGELYRLPDGGETLARLDHHEGCGPGHEPPHEFMRGRAEVTPEAGGVRTAWIYWYRGEPRGERLVSGDYLERSGPPSTGGHRDRAHASGGRALDPERGAAAPVRHPKDPSPSG